MPAPTRATSVRWPVPIALAVPALGAAITVTFSSGHSAEFGLLVFGVFALLTAAAAFFGVAALPPGIGRAGSGVKGAVAAVGGVLGLVFALVQGGDAVQLAAQLAFCAAGTFALLAVIDLVTGIRSRRADRFARDWITIGVIEALAAVVLLVVPPTFYQSFSFTEKTGEVISGAVTSSTMIVGLFGAATAILGVFLAIAGVGLIPQRERRERATA